MKKLTYILILSCVMFCSCIIEHGEKPKKSQWARNIAFEVATTWSKTLSVANIAHKANMWLLASGTDRYEIEDEYFQNYKLRMIEDIIIVKDLCRINTFGKPLISNDVVWEITMYDAYLDNPTTKVSYLDENTLRAIQNNLEPLGTDRSDSSLDILFNDATFSVSGTGICHTREHGNAKYTINNNLTVIYNNSRYEHYTYECYTKGSLLIEIDSQINKKINVEYNKDMLTIKIDDYTETYHVYN